MALSFFLPEDRGLIEVTGKDAAVFLQGLFSQDVVKNFSEGSVTYGVFPTPKGRVFSDAYIHHTSPNCFFLDVEGIIVSALLSHLNHYLILLDAEVKNKTGEYELISILGEQSVGPDFSSNEAFVSFVQRGEFHEYRVWVVKSQKEKWLRNLQVSGAVRVSSEFYEMMQIEAVIPKLGIEMDETTFPQEVGLEEYLNFKKGCFIGAEVLQRIFYQGHVNRALVLLGLGECRNRVKNLKVFEESEEVGKITRSIFSLPRNRVTALGLLKVSALDSKKSLYARDGEEKILLEVLKQPQMQRQ